MRYVTYDWWVSRDVSRGNPAAEMTTIINNSAGIINGRAGIYRNSSPRAATMPNELYNAIVECVHARSDPAIGRDALYVSRMQLR